MSFSFFCFQIMMARHFVSAMSEGLYLQQRSRLEWALFNIGKCQFLYLLPLKHKIFHLPIAEERSLVVIPQCTKNYISAVFVVKLIPRERPRPILSCYWVRSRKSLVFLRAKYASVRAWKLPLSLLFLRLTNDCLTSKNNALIIGLTAVNFGTEFKLKFFKCP